MKKYIKFITLGCLLAILYSQAFALVKEKRSILTGGNSLWATTFIDYPPFGYIGKFTSDIDTVFQPVLDKFNEQQPNHIYFANEGTYAELIDKTVNGKIDILIGAYYDSQAYNGIKLIYPALINNPVVVVTMPESNISITSKTDLKDYKGGIDSREYFADYVTHEIDKLNIQKFTDSNKMYEQLFIGNLDYVLTSRYYGALEQAKLGIRSMVNMQKQALWDMPMFLGVSSITRKGKLTINTLKDFMKKNHQDLKKLIEQNIIEEIHKADEAARGIVPPAYIK